MKAVNSAGRQTVLPKTVTDRDELKDGLLQSRLGKASWNVIRLGKIDPVFKTYSPAPQGAERQGPEDKVSGPFHCLFVAEGVHPNMHSYVNPATAPLRSRIAASAQTAASPSRIQGLSSITPVNCPTIRSTTGITRNTALCWDSSTLFGLGRSPHNQSYRHHGNGWRQRRKSIISQFTPGKAASPEGPGPRFPAPGT